MSPSPNGIETGEQDSPMATKSVWVIAEHTKRGLHEAALEVLGEARALVDQLQGELHAVVLGDEITDLAATLFHYGAQSVYLVQHPLLKEYTTDGYVHALAQLLRDRDARVLMLGGTPNGQDLAPRLAARLCIGLAADCMRVKLNSSGELGMTRPVYQDKVHAVVTWPGSRPMVVTMRPGARGSNRPDPSRQGQVFEVRVQLEDDVIRARPVGFIKGDPKQIDLSEAELVVAGGRGVEPGRWGVVEDAAKQLGAAVGGSRMAMDQGWIGRERMIGLTGKTIHPKLYLAAGISGASQHMGGVRDSEVVIAINTDPAAPCLKQADLGIVGDLHEVLPALTRRLQEIRLQDGRAETERRL